MANPDAKIVVASAVNLTRTHPQAPALDVLDLVMTGRTDQILDFKGPTASNGSLADPGSPFGSLLAAAFDEAMTPNEWAAFTGSNALPALRDACLEIWRTYVMPRFAARFGVGVRGLP